MRVDLLGPLLVEGDDGEVALGAAKERSLLCALALSPGLVVSGDALVAALWGDVPPASARKTLQTYVSNLRRALGPDAVTTHPSGYALRVAPGDVDVHRFRALVHDGEAALRTGSLADARRNLGDAVGLWRGQPFAGVGSHTGLAGAALRLREEYLTALEARVAADLAEGRHGEVIGELEALVHEHPFRERLWAHLMVALYRDERQADALAAYQRARELLVEELGLEPGGELRRIEEAILDHDPSLAAPRPTRPPADERSGPRPGVIPSPVRYARSSDGVSIAYQVAGHGPIDLLAIPGFVTHLDIWWNAPTDGLVRRLTSLSRLISFDKRGMGLSDRPDSIDAEMWVDDALAVLDAVGARDVVVLGVSAGTPTAIRLAARHRDRVRGLVVFAGGARTIAGPGYEIGHDRETLEDFAANLEDRWGSGVAISSYAPSRAAQPHVRDYWARYQQLSAGPAAAIRSFWAAVETDVTDLLASIDAPTLVLHPERDVISPVAWGRYLADRIKDAEFVALDSDVDLICVSDVIDDVAEEIDAFIRRAVLGKPRPSDEVEPTLVTAIAVRTSSRAQADVLAVIERCGGRVQPPAVTATFDSPTRALRAVSAIVAETELDDIGVGVQTGECVRTDTGYCGPAVDTARELAALAAAGQALLTRTVSDLVTGKGFVIDDTPVDVRGLDAAIMALVTRPPERR